MGFGKVGYFLAEKILSKGDELGLELGASSVPWCQTMRLFSELDHDVPSFLPFLQHLCGIGRKTESPAQICQFLKMRYARTCGTSSGSDLTSLSKSPTQISRARCVFDG